MSTYKVETEQGTFIIKPIEKGDVYVKLESYDCYEKFYEVTSPNSTLAFFLGKGHPDAPKEIVGWYRGQGDIHFGYGETFEEIINLLIRDAWKFA